LEPGPTSQRAESALAGIVSSIFSMDLAGLDVADSLVVLDMTSGLIEAEAASIQDVKGSAWLQRLIKCLRTVSPRRGIS
jgi:hypothetical protein